MVHVFVLHAVSPIEFLDVFSQLRENNDDLPGRENSDQGVLWNRQQVSITERRYGCNEQRQYNETHGQGDHRVSDEVGL